jgi:hypothetical protein
MPIGNPMIKNKWLFNWNISFKKIQKGCIIGSFKEANGG